MIQITTGISPYALAGYLEQILAPAKSERFCRACFYTAGEFTLDQPGVVAHGALSDPRGKGAVIFESRNVEGAGDHAIPAAHTDGGIVSNCTLFCLGVSSYKA